MSSSNERILAAWQQRLVARGLLDDATVTIGIEIPTADEVAADNGRVSSIGLDPHSVSSLHTAATVAGWKDPRASSPSTSPIAIDERYSIMHMLGSGGMGEVFLARQQRLEREVAVKVLKRRPGRSQRADAFRTEVHITGLLDHPGVVPVHDAGDDFYVMKRIRGHTLEQLLLEGLSPERMVEILLRVCDTVAFAHHKGIIHRDIKPANIMVGAFGETLLLDWGLAVCVDPSRRGEGPLLPHLATMPWAGGGTPAYAAPEMVAGDPSQIGYASDVFLLGATLYRCLAGRPPYQSSGSMAALDAALACRHPPLSELAPEAPGRLLRLVEACMAADPAARIGLAEVNARLHDWQHHAGASAEARTALSEAEQLAAEAAQLSDTVAAYYAWQEAIAGYERARTLDPESPTASLRRHAARAAYAQRALAADDLALAAAIVEREDADEATTPLVEVRNAIHSAVQRRTRNRRRLRQLSVLSLVFIITTLALASYEGWRLAGDQATKAELAQREAELSSASERHLADLLLLVEQALSEPLAEGDGPWQLVATTRSRFDQLAKDQPSPQLAAPLLAAYTRLGEYCVAHYDRHPSAAAEAEACRAAATALAKGLQDHAALNRLRSWWRPGEQLHQ